jgi:hypothetical protein
MCHEGRLGKIQKVECRIGGSTKSPELPEVPVPTGLNWELWCGQAPLAKYVSSPTGSSNRAYPASRCHYEFRWWYEYSGGKMTDWGAHHNDIAQWGLGMDESGPVEIIAAEKENAKHGVRLKYANGVEVIHTDGNGVTFEGTEGKIYVNRGKFEATPAALGEEPLKADAIRLYESNDHKGDWLTCIRNRKKPICDVDIGAHTVIVCHLVNLAYYHHQSFKWDPAKFKFVGGTGDKTWLTREYRSPWKLA